MSALPSLVSAVTVTRSPSTLAPGHFGFEVELEALLDQALVEQVPYLEIGHRRDPGRNSMTVTFDPSRFQTELSSRPM